MRLGLSSWGCSFYWTQGSCTALASFDPQVYKTALSIGYNPHFNNAHKTCEPWILHSFDKEFYGEEIRLVVCSYLRPEAKFTTLQVCGGAFA